MGFKLMTKEFNLYYWLAQAPDKAVMARYFEGVLTSIAVSKLECTTQEEEGKLHTKLRWLQVCHYNTAHWYLAT